ncbi:MAG: hypothetical protein ACLGI5_10310 [Thermoleophilia bacterium]
MNAIRQMPRPARMLTWILVVALAAFALELALQIAPGASGEPFEKYVSNLVVFGSALLCGWRAVAMRTDRPYAAHSSADAACAELRRCAGSQFDPVVVEALCEVLAEHPHGELVSLRGSAGPSPA